MLLEELVTADLNFLVKALRSLEKDMGDWSKLPQYAHSAEALKEAVTLYNWVIDHGQGKLISQSLTSLVASSAMTTTRSLLFKLAQTGFSDRNPLIHDLHTKAIVGNTPGHKAARQEALGFIKATRHLLYTLKFLGNLATPGTSRYESADGLNRKLAAVTLRKLGVKGDNLSIDA